MGEAVVVAAEEEEVVDEISELYTPVVIAHGSLDIEMKWWTFGHETKDRDVWAFFETRFVRKCSLSSATCTAAP